MGLSRKKGSWLVVVEVYLTAFSDPHLSDPSREDFKDHSALGYGRVFSSVLAGTLWPELRGRAGNNAEGGGNTSVPDGDTSIPSPRFEIECGSRAVDPIAVEGREAELQPPVLSPTMAAGYDEPCETTRGDHAASTATAVGHGNTADQAAPMTSHRASLKGAISNIRCGLLMFVTGWGLGATRATHTRV